MSGAFCFVGGNIGVNSIGNNWIRLLPLLGILFLLSSYNRKMYLTPSLHLKLQRILLQSPYQKGYFFACGFNVING
jgi:hypothetical protein